MVKRIKNYKYVSYLKVVYKLLMILLIIALLPISAFAQNQHKAASNSNLVSYAKNLLLTVVDNNFRGSWVIAPENWDKVAKTTKKVQKSFDSLGKISIGNTPEQIKSLLGEPNKTKNNRKIWIYGNPIGEETYEDLLQVFFDDKLQHVTGIISFNPKDIPEKVGVNIGAPIEKMISIYGEPVDEKDFYEDSDNKDSLGLYYLYPRSGIGFFVGQNKISKNLSIEGVFVFGKS